MNKLLMSFAVVLLVAVAWVGAVFFAPGAGADSAVDAELSISTVASVDTDKPVLLNHSDPASGSSRGQNILDPHRHDVHAESTHPADRFEDLPLAIQQQVKALNPNDNALLEIEQLSATVGVVRVAHVHQFVPVARLNDDGSVTIAEY